jgi:hypothetical protein
VGKKRSRAVIRLPPHLMVLIGFLIVVIWLMLLRHFRRSPGMQRLVSEILGDDSAESALIAFESARRHLMDHLNDSHLDCDLRERIELALGPPPSAEPQQLLTSDHVN